MAACHKGPQGPEAPLHLQEVHRVTCIKQLVLMLFMLISQCKCCYFVMKVGSVFASQDAVLVKNHSHSDKENEWEAPTATLIIRKCNTPGLRTAWNFQTGQEKGHAYKSWGPRGL